MTDTIVAEGQVKFRDGKKWKTRWVVLQKPSPVADCLTLLMWKAKKKGKSGRRKDGLNVTLEGICGVEPGPGYDGVSYTLSILCLAHSLVLGFSSRDTLLAWDTRLRYSLGEVHRFSVGVEPGTKLESGPASLHLCNNLLVLTRGLPPVVVGSWKLSALRRYGAVPNGFVFEGGTRCGLWAGVYFLSCSEGEQVSFLFDCIVRGIAPGRALRPHPPADPNADPTLAEERISQETSELEKRLSLLSHCSLASSSASSYSYSTSVAGDDHSISSSSSSQSETSYGGRLPFWMEPSIRSLLSNETASSTSTLKALTRSDDRLYGSVMGGPGSRPSSAQLHSRGLNDSGRQSSLDSGIGIATGSQSSYSGSYSSCTGSLDMANQGGGEEYGSVVSLPPHPLHAPCSPPPARPPSPPPSPVQSSSAPSQACTSKSGSGASRRHSEEYQLPSLLRWWYDTPRSLLQALSRRGTPAQGATPDLSQGDGQGQVLNTDVGSQHQGSMQRSLSWGNERTGSVDAERTNSADTERTPFESNDGRSTPRPQLVPASPAHRETQVESASFSDFSATFTSATQNLCAREQLCDGEDAGKLGCLRRTLPSSPPSAPPPPPPPVAFRPTSAATFPTAFDTRRPASTQNEPRGGRTVNYVNIPLGLQKALTAELLYTELDLQRHASAPVSSSYSIVGGDSLQVYTPAGADSIGYAHLDIAAMATAQRVGAEHVQGREDRLTQLESRWRGPPN